MSGESKKKMEIHIQLADMKYIDRVIMDITVLEEFC